MMNNMLTEVPRGTNDTATSGLTERDELKKLSPEARKVRATVEAGKAAEEELRKMDQAKDTLRRTLRDHLDMLRQTVSERSDVFEKMSAETARLLELYRQSADEGSRQDQAFIGGIEDYLRDLGASREAQERLRR